MAVLQLTICQVAGVKINGRKPKLEDFVSLSKSKGKKDENPALAEARLKVALEAMTARKIKQSKDK